jgi:transposase
MRQEVLVMTAREAKRLYVVQQVLERKLRQRPAAELCACSVRQLRRWIARVRQAGPPGIGHRSRGRPSNRRYPERVRQRVLQLWQTTYRDFGPTLTQEKLAERDHLHVGRETVRRWLGAAGLWVRQRQGRAPHRWRERKAAWGEMLQLDGSHHDWLEGRGPRLVLMAYIDDATSRVFARFYDYEGTAPALDSFARYVRRYGLPQSLYADRHMTYHSPGKRSVADELAGRPRPQSQFERAVTALGVTLIPAHSPQAKGRVERLFRTFQDRVIKEMRLAQVTTRDAANRFLRGYLPRYNRRFSRLPQRAGNLHRPAPPWAALRRVLAIRETHALRHDNTVRHATKLYLLDDRWPVQRPKTLQVEERLDGKLYLLDGDRVLRYHEVQERPLVPPRRHAPTGSQRRRTPAADHPWRRFSLAKNRTVLTSQKEDISIGR